MSTPPLAPANPPGVVRVAVGALIWTVFVVKCARWWLAVWAGAASFESTTGGQWVKLGFYHLAVVAGAVGIVQMLRERERVTDANPPAASDQ